MARRRASKRSQIPCQLPHGRTPFKDEPGTRLTVTPSSAVNKRQIGCGFSALLADREVDFEAVLPSLAARFRMLLDHAAPVRRRGAFPRDLADAAVPARDPHPRLSQLQVQHVRDHAPQRWRRGGWGRGGRRGRRGGGGEGAGWVAGAEEGAAEAVAAGGAGAAAGAAAEGGAAGEAAGGVAAAGVAE